MKLSRLFLPAAFVAAVLSAQTADQDNLGVNLNPTINQLSWWGVPGNHFLVQVQTELGTPWIFVPSFNPAGEDGVLARGVPTPEPDEKLFYRIIQFDPTDITGHADTDNDGLPDIWEMYQFGDLSHNGSGDDDADGISNLREFQGGNNPNEAQATASASLTTYTYDLTGRLTQAESSSYSTTFSPDAEGNLLSAQ